MFITNLTVKMSDKIEEFLLREHVVTGFAGNIQTVSELLDDTEQDLFHKLQFHDHCSVSILPEEKSLEGQRFQLSRCFFNFFLISFINHCLFNHVYYYYDCCDYV